MRTPILLWRYIPRLFLHSPSKSLGTMPNLVQFLIGQRRLTLGGFLQENLMCPLRCSVTLHQLACKMGQGTVALSLRYAFRCLAGQHQLLNRLFPFVPDYLFTGMSINEPRRIKSVVIKKGKPCLNGTFQPGIFPCLLDRLMGKVHMKSWTWGLAVLHFSIMAAGCQHIAYTRQHLFQLFWRNPFGRNI